MLEHAGDEHDHNASNHGHDSAATAHTNDDYNDAHERRLLSSQARRGRTYVGGACGLSLYFEKQHGIEPAIDLDIGRIRPTATYR